jgi:D-inositol-3-phosphate glycosyltransferase
MRRKIAIISEHASPLADLGGVDSGGQNVYVAHLARQLANAGHLVDVFTRKDRSDLPQIVNWKPGLRVIHVPAGPARIVPKEELLPFMNDFTEFMDCFIRQEETPYQIVHANFWMSGLVAADLKRAFGIPFAITFHALGRIRRIYQGKDDGFPDQRFEIEERVIREADAVIAECPQDHQDLVDLYQAPVSKIATIPCGFDPDELWPVDREIARQFLGISGDQRVVLQLGRMVPRKGVDTAIRGFAMLQRDRKLAASLVIVGGETDERNAAQSPEIGVLAEIAREEGVADRVHFTGRMDRSMLKYYYSAADVFVSTPWYEPFGITPLEAMACRIPVVGSAVGGLKTTIENGITGYLVPPNDPVALADRLEVLLGNPAAARQMGENGHLRANAEFTWEQVTQAISETYEKVIASTVCLEKPALTQSLSVRRGFQELVDTLKRSQLVLEDQIAACSDTIQAAFNRGEKVLICGNGGSAADAQHFAGELVGRFRLPDRPALPALALTADSAVLTAWANDVGFEKIFARQVEALAQPGDVLIGISTSGNSLNLIEAFRAAHQKGVECVALLGGDGGDLLPLSNLALIVPSADAQRIQEVHIFLIHAICELIEEQMVAQAEKTASALAGRHAAWVAQPGTGVSVSYNRTD